MKKRILSMILASTMVLGMFPVTALGYETEGEGNQLPATEEVAVVSSDTGGTPDTGGEFEVETLSTDTTKYFDGEGTAASPYIIRTTSDLGDLAGLMNSSIGTVSTKYLSAHYRVEAGGTTLYVRDDNTTSDLIFATQGTFTGVFDGNNATINMSVNRSAVGTGQYFGLFCSVGSDAVIKNLNVTGNFTVTSGTSGALKEETLEIHIGSIAGILQSTAKILNCTSSVDVTLNVATGTTTSGTAYEASPGTGSSSPTSVVNYKAESYVGGIVGCIYSEKAFIMNCANNGEVRATAYASLNQYSDSNTAAGYAGGLVGRNYGYVVNSYNLGFSYAKSEVHDDTGTKKFDSYNTESAINYSRTGNAYSYAGGLVGKGESGYIYNSYQNANYVDTLNTGFYYTANSTGTGSKTAKVYDDPSHAGGIMGTGTSTIDNCFWWEGFDGTAYSGSTNICSSNDSGHILGEQNLFWQLHTWVENKNSNLSYGWDNSSIATTWLVNRIYNERIVHYFSDDVTDFIDFTTYRLYQWNDTSVAYPTNKIDGSTPTGVTTSILAPDFAYRINVVERENGVSIGDAGHVTVTVDNSYIYPDQANEEDIVYVTVDPAGGIDIPEYRVLTMTVYEANGDEVETIQGANIYEWSFEMPDASVVIVVEYKQLSPHGCTCCADINDYGWIAIEENYKSGLLTGGTNYYLADDVELTESLVLPNDVILCLNGHTLTAASDEVVSVSGETVTLCGGECTGTNGVITNTGTGYGISVTSIGTLNMIGGHITECYGAGVYVENGSIFNLSGGEISGNNTSSVGSTSGEVHIASGGTMTVSGDPVVSGTNGGVSLPRDTYIDITGALTAGASIAVTPHADNNQKIAYTNDESLDISTFDDYFVGAEDNADAFYRLADKCIYLAKIDAEAKDFQLTLNDGVSSTPPVNCEIPEGEEYYDIFTEYTDKTQTIDVTLNGDSAASIYYYKDGKQVFDGMKDVGVYDIYGVLSDNAGNANYNVDTEHYLGTVTITQYSLETAHYDATLSQTQYDYTGSSCYPTPTVTLHSAVLNGNALKTFTLGTDYTVAYLDSEYKTSTCINRGTYTVRITSTDTCNYEFTCDKTFTIGIGLSTDLNVINLNDLDFKPVTYGDDINIVLQPKSGTEIMDLAHAKDYVISLYVVTEEGNVPIGEFNCNSSAVKFDEKTGYYTFVYDTSNRDMVIGYNEVFIEFQPIKGVSNPNMDYATAGFTIDLTKKPLLAKVPEGYSRVYDGTNKFVLELDYGTVNQNTEDKTHLVEMGDDVVLVGTGSSSDSAVGNTYKLSITDVGIFGEQADYYSIGVGDVDTAHRVAISALKLDSVTKHFDIDVMLGVGTFAAPQLTYTVDKGEVGEYEAVIEGSLVYTTPGFESYDAIVAHLKTLPVNSVLDVNYTFTPYNGSNFEGADIKGTIRFLVVNIKFEEVKLGLQVVPYPIYGNDDNIFYDPSFFVARVGTASTTGDYKLVVKNSLGYVQEQGVENYAHLPVDEYTYEVYFTSFDNAYVEVLVTAGVFYVNPRVLEYTWDSVNFVYDSTAKLPVPTITNRVGTDDVNIVASGSNAGVGSYSASLALTGADRDNYKLLIDSVGYKIEAAVTKGVVTVLYNDTDASETLTIGDVVTADLIAVSPSGGTAMYHWYRNDVLISGATSASYTLGSADVVGTVLRCDVSFSGNTTGTLSSHGMVVGNKFFKGSVVISHEEGVLTATVSGENTTNYSIIWTGLTQSSAGTTYTMGYEDFNNPIVVTVLANELSGYTGSVSGTITVSSKKPFVPEITAAPGDTSVTVNWDVGFHGGAPIQNYILTVKNEAKNDFTGSPFTIAGDAESFVVTGLTNGHTYTFQLDVVNAVGTSTSNIVSATAGEVNGSVDVNGDITTTTTVKEYEDNDGNKVTETVVVVYDAATGITVTTTTIEIEYRDGASSTDVTVETKDKDKVVLELTEDYVYTDEDEEFVLEFETFWDEDDSSGSLVVTETREDTIEVAVSVMNRVLLREDTTATFITPNGQVTFDNEALRSIFYQAEPMSRDSFVMEILKTTNDVLPTLVQGRLANAYVVELLVTVGGVEVSDFGDGLVNVVLPYQKENMGQNTSVYHISDTGAMTRFVYAVYDGDDKNVTFNTRHFSYYAVVEELSKFTDVYSTDYFYDAILWAVQNEVSYGTTSLTFSPQLICTRGEAMTMIWTAMGSNVADIVVPFKDIAPNDYYYEAVRWAYATAITGGVRQFEFGPLEECTRAQIITFLWTAAGKPIVETTLNFNDVPAGCWYESAVKWAVSEGITTGTYANTFGPEEPCTRGQIVTFLYQALGTAGI